MIVAEFWGALMLPIADLWTIKKRQGAPITPRTDPVSAIPVFVYRYQVIAIYALAAISKSGDDWVSGYAVHKTVMLDMFRKYNFFTDLLRDNPWM